MNSNLIGKPGQYEYQIYQTSGNTTDITNKVMLESGIAIFHETDLTYITRNKNNEFIFRDGYFNQQQGLPRLWDTDDEPGSLHEVLPHQSRRAGRGANGAVAAGLQAPAGRRPMQKLHPLEGAVFARVSRGRDTRGGGALFRQGG